MSELRVTRIINPAGGKVQFPDGLDVGGEGLIQPADYRVSRGQFDPRNNTAVIGIATAQSSWFLLRDSYGDGVGASEYALSCGWMFCRSMVNANDGGYGKERGYGYHSNLNWDTAVASGFFEHNGTIIDEGIVRTRLVLINGQSLTVKGVATDFADLQVVGVGAGNATVEVRRNGVLARTITIGNTPVMASTFTGQKVRDDGVLTADSDLLTFNVTAGTIKVRCPITWRQAGFSPAGYFASRGGTTYSDYTSEAALDEIAYDLNFARPPGTMKVLGLGLGTNSMCNPAKFQTPAQMLASVDLMRVGLAGRVVGIQFAIHVPARPTASWTQWCPKEGGGVYTWEEYRDAILAYAYQYSFAIVRHDLSPLADGNPAYFVGDGLHLNNAGHRIDAQNWCDTFGVPFNPSMKAASVPFSPPAELAALIDAAGGGTEGVWAPVAQTPEGDLATAYGVRNGTWTKDAQGWVTAMWDVVATFDGAVPAAGRVIQIGGLNMPPLSNYEGSGWISFMQGMPLPAGTVGVGAGMTGSGRINIICSKLDGSDFANPVVAGASTAPGFRISGGVRFKPV